MKRFILILIISLMLIPTVLAQRVYQFNTSVNVNDDDSSDIRFNFKFTDDIKKIEIPLEGEITDLHSENGKCQINQEVGQIIVCEPPSPFIVGTIKLDVDFKIKGLVERRGNISFFSFDIPILWDTDDVYVTVKIPEKAMLAEKVKLPISPSGADTRIEGRKIIAKWYFWQKNPGDVIPIRIYYEPLTPKIIESPYPRYIVLVSIIFVIAVVLIYRRVSYKKSELVFSVLNKNEKMVIDIIKKEKKEKVDQRKIVRESGFSKAKVSRIIQSLQERGVVESERVGRKNKITLKKHFIKKEK